MNYSIINDNKNITVTQSQIYAFGLTDFVYSQCSLSLFNSYKITEHCGKLCHINFHGSKQGSKGTEFKRLCFKGSSLKEFPT